MRAADVAACSSVTSAGSASLMTILTACACAAVHRATSAQTSTTLLISRSFLGTDLANFNYCSLLAYFPRLRKALFGLWGTIFRDYAQIRGRPVPFSPLSGAAIECSITRMPFVVWLILCGIWGSTWLF